MYICPNCQKTSETPINFCNACGSRMVEQPTYEQPTYEQPVQPAYEQPVQPAYEQPVQPAYEQPVYQQPAYEQPVQPQYQQPQYQQVQYQQYAPAQPSKGKQITGMVFGIVGLAFAAIGLLYTFIGMAADGAMGFGMGFAFSLFSMPLSLVGLIMSNKCMNEGAYSGMTSAGKKCGLIGVILTGVMLLFALISLGTI